MPTLTGSAQSQRSETTPYAPFAQGYFKNELLPLTQRMTADFAQRGGQGIAKARDYAMETLGGKYLMGNPYMEQFLDASRKSYTDMADRNINTAAGNAARAGMLASTSAAAMKNAAAQDANDAWGRMDAGTRMQNYQTERGYQNQAAGALAGLDAQEAANLLQMINMFRGGGTTKSSGFGIGATLG